ncbi:MAG: hypothetical protein COV36_01320 [Alphaproteobacteria bacterium CG11_big_fil_rev_8_21_14_0_20_44_7]|nr:MAG: hypothetical protein COV36_01320 [Alphaproteobacteria bacterium CG11_big_fil_rev_8_21_14_0_20_44_7]
MTDINDIKVAVIGCGYWGRNHVRNYHELGNLAAICDNHPENEQMVVSQFSTKAMSFEEILADDEIQAIVIATPAPAHYAVADAALDAGKHVFVEKPLTLNIKESEALAAKSEKLGLTLMVGHLLQYHSAFIKVKELIANGEIGNLLRVYSNRISFGKVQTAENVLWSLGPHDISMILSVTNEEPSEVVALGSAYLSPQYQDFVHTHLTFPSGVTAHIFNSWLSPFKEHKFVATGDKGSIIFDDTQAWETKVAICRHNVTFPQNAPPLHEKADLEYVALEQSEPLKDECRHFLQSIATRETPRTDGREGLRVLKVLTQAQNSLEAAAKKQLKQSA